MRVHVVKVVTRRAGSETTVVRRGHSFDVQTLPKRRRDQSEILFAHCNVRTRNDMKRFSNTDVFGGCLCILRSLSYADWHSQFLGPDDVLEITLNGTCGTCVHENAHFIYEIQYDFAMFSAVECVKRDRQARKSRKLFVYFISWDTIVDESAKNVRGTISITVSIVDITVVCCLVAFVVGVVAGGGNHDLLLNLNCFAHLLFNGGHFLSRGTTTRCELEGFRLKPIDELVLTAKLLHETGRWTSVCRATILLLLSSTHSVGTSILSRWTGTRSQFACNVGHTKLLVVRVRPERIR